MNPAFECPAASMGGSWGAYDFRMIVEPDMSNHVIYDDVFGVFKDRFVALREAGAYDKVVAVENKHWGDSE